MKRRTSFVESLHLWMGPTMLHNEHPEIVQALLSKLQEKAYLPPDTQKIVAECLSQIIHDAEHASQGGDGTDGAAEGLLARITPEAAPKYVDTVMSHIEETLSWAVKEQFDGIIVAVVTAAFEEAATQETFEPDTILASIATALQEVVMQEGVSSDNMELVLVVIRQALQKVLQVINAIQGA